MSSSFGAARTELEQMGRRSTHPGHFTSSSSIKVKDHGTPIQWNMVEVPSGEVFSELQSNLRRRHSSRGIPPMLEDDVETTGEKTIDEEISEMPVWYKTLTLRSLIVAAILGAAFSIISLKLGLTSGVIPSLNIAAGLLSFFMVKSTVTLATKLGFKNIKPFTKQENTVIQTCVVACYGMAFAGGFGTYVLGMDSTSWANVGNTYEANGPEPVAPWVYDPDLKRIIPYMFCIALLGIFFLLPLRNLFILKYNLPYPSGTATGLMINSFFTEEGSEIAQKQLNCMGKWFAFSFIFDFWKWFFTADGDCGTVTGGFSSFPTFSLQAYNWTWYFNFEQNYVGVGMLCPLIVDYSVMVGAILSWGIMWPLISKNEGDWYPAGLPRNSFEGLYAYQTFTAIALFIGDGLYLLGKLLILTAMDIREAKRAERNQAVVTVHTQKSTTDDAIPSLPRQPLDNTAAAAKEHADDELLDTGETARERALRVKVFTTGAIPWWVGLGGYCVLLVVAVVAIPYLYPPAKWYMCLCVALISPLLAFANAYGAGLTDWNMASLYGKLIILIFAAWGGVDNAGVTSGLAVCGIGFASIAAASDLMQDFKTGYLTSSSPRAMFVAQLVGAIMGCVIAPLCFLMFYSSFDLGVPGTQYAAPYATVYRGMAVLGAQGFSNLPSHCAQLMAGFFGIAFALNLARDFLPEKYGKWVPLPMGVALTFYLGAWLAISMMLGGLIVVVWKWIDKRNNTDSCSLYSSVLASGLIAGSGIWTIPSAILAVAGVNPPICMGWSDGS